MGAIRLIAAEEELVVAIFEWLKLNTAAMPEHRDFIGKHKNHRVKLAFYPVLSRFRFVLGDMLTHGITVDGLEDVLHWHVTPAKIGNRVLLRISDGASKEFVMHNPLAVAVSQDDRTDDEVIGAMYDDFARLIREQHSKGVRAFVTERAEYRNKLLYAEDSGFLAMAESLEELINNVFRTTLRDLLWCLAVLLANVPVSPDHGLVAQFVGLYRRVLAECRLVQG
mgnify:CR=1 FL=1